MTEGFYTLDEIMKNKQHEYHLLHYEEKRVHWKKLQVLKQELIPAFITYAHGLIRTYLGPRQYQDTLKSLFYARFVDLNTTGMRRVIFRHIQQADPWWSTGGQSPPGRPDVEEQPQPQTDLNFGVLEDVFAQILGPQELLDWARSD
ncbi:hypothetical protein BCR42DRAFT_397385 [Absidia repens]|uniref:Uncharacterized protein n=1 Tax=Absidia repens TaxID=90262 RepID=A0A1X2I0Y1_9FUNG|nr:hypothetical protein BCR42DRAFT_397385 [Absidia repens]